MGHVPREVEAVAGDDHAGGTVELRQNPAEGVVCGLGAGPAESEPGAQPSRKVREPEEPLALVAEHEPEPGVERRRPRFVLVGEPGCHRRAIAGEGVTEALQRIPGSHADAASGAGSSMVRPRAISPMATRSAIQAATTSARAAPMPPVGVAAMEVLILGRRRSTVRTFGRDVANQRAIPSSAPLAAT